MAYLMSDIEASTVRESGHVDCDIRTLSKTKLNASTSLPTSGMLNTRMPWDPPDSTNSAKGFRQTPNHHATPSHIPQASPRCHLNRQIIFRQFEPSVIQRKNSKALRPCPTADLRCFTVDLRNERNQTCSEDRSSMGGSSGSTEKNDGLTPKTSASTSLEEGAPSSP